MKTVSNEMQQILDALSGFRKSVDLIEEIIDLMPDDLDWAKKNHGALVGITKSITELRFSTRRINTRLKNESVHSVLNEVRISTCRIYIRSLYSIQYMTRSKNPKNLDRVIELSNQIKTLL